MTINHILFILIMEKNTFYCYNLISIKNENECNIKRIAFIKIQGNYEISDGHDK